MSIDLKTPEDISNMRIAGRLAAEVLEMIEEYVKPGISTGELDRICHRYIAVSYTHLTLPTTPYV